MTKKAKAKQVVVEKKEQMIVDDLSIGDIVPDLHGVDVEITDDLISDMKTFESEGKTKAIWRNKITGMFLFWRMNKDKPKKEKKVKKAKPKVVEEEIEEELEDIEVEYDDEEEIDEMEEIEEAVDEVNKLDEAIEIEAEEEIDELELIDEAYKEKFSVQKVNRNAKKYKAFAKKYRESE